MRGGDFLLGEALWRLLLRAQGRATFARGRQYEGSLVQCTPQHLNLSWADDASAIVAKHMPQRLVPARALYLLETHFDKDKEDG